MPPDADPTTTIDAAAVVASLPVAVVVAAIDGTVCDVNDAFLTLFGSATRPHRLTDLFDGGAVPALTDAGQADLRRADGTTLPCRVTVRHVDGPDTGELLLMVLQPVGDTARQLERLRRSEQRLSTLLQHLPLGIIGSDSGMGADYVNAAGAEVFSVGPESLVGTGWLRYIHPDDADHATDALEDALSERRPAFVPLRIVPPEGGHRWAHLRVAPVGVGDDVGFVASIEDLTEQRQLGDALAYQARHDALTGLWNRSMVEEQLRDELDRATGTGTRPALLFVDLDDFKDINDSLGHLLGDRVLAEMADRLFEATAPDGVVARFGGDEFVVVLPDRHDADSALDAGRHIVRRLSRPFQVDGHDVYCTVSVGVAWTGGSDPAATGPSEFLRRADLALYQAKRAGKNQAVLASDDLLAGERQRLRMTRALRRAVHEDLLDVHYQPIVDLGDERIVGLEALVRWTDPELGRINPDVFVPTAEANGLVGELGRNVLRRALGELAAWRRLPGQDRLYVSVNMSMEELDEQAVARQLARALGDADLPASALYVELTESALLRRESTAVERLEAIRRLGIRLAIDDFGTGYSNLARLRRLPVDLVKIDREFVRDLGIDPQAAAVVGAIANLAAAMGLFTVAEGIETPTQLAELRRVAGGYGQGYLFSRPVPAEEVPGLLLRRTAGRAA